MRSIKELIEISERVDEAGAVYGQVYLDAVAHIVRLRDIAHSIAAKDHELSQLRADLASVRNSRDTYKQVAKYNIRKRLDLQNRYASLDRENADMTDQLCKKISESNDFSTSGLHAQIEDLTTRNKKLVSAICELLT